MNNHLNEFELSIFELGGLLQTKNVTPVELVKNCLRRIEELNPKINAFITVLADQALNRARDVEAEINAGNWRGALHGIPVGIKDFYDTAGIRTTAAFEHFSARVPAKDALNVTKLKEAGAIIIGKTNMDQLGMGTTGLESFFGPVINPWNDQYISGGSSSGSAAAVASGMCYATLDTDAIGSCRLPAACCGVVGFKGTYGLISPKGILDGEPSPSEEIEWLSHPGITTRSVKDTALFLDVLAIGNGNQKNEFSNLLTRPRTLRIGVANNFTATQEVVSAFEKCVETIQRLGHSLIHKAVPFGDPNRGIKNIETDRKEIAELAFGDIDVLILPTTTTTVPAVRDAGTNPLALSPDNTVFANYYGISAISIQCGFDSHGLPLGLQIAGKPSDDSTVLQLAHQYQSITDFHKIRPSVAFRNR